MGGHPICRKQLSGPECVVPCRAAGSADDLGLHDDAVTAPLGERRVGLRGDDIALGHRTVGVSFIVVALNKADMATTRSSSTWSR